MEKMHLTIDDIIIAFLKGKISNEEKKTLTEWLAANPENKIYFRQVYQTWNAADLQVKDEAKIDQALMRLKYQNNVANIEGNIPKIKQLRYSFGRYAAVIMLSLVCGAVLYALIEKASISKVSKIAYNEITAPLGSKSNIRLPDGTEVTLNAGSKLTYKMDYGEKTREVTFIGEGYFKVAKQKTKPFIVHTYKASIRALGTEFNVKAYPDENIIETILVKGSVLVNENGKSRNKGIILKPGEKIQIYKTITQKNKNEEIATGNQKALESLPSQAGKSAPHVAKTDIHVETSWKEKQWIIQSEGLQSLAVLLYRKFGVPIQINDTSLFKYKFSGIIENETLEQIFSIMKLTIPISYTMNKGEVKWYFNGKLEKNYKEAY
jgi:ferric-dicitrate binding protein FerR (iron transport regulator)